MEVSEAFFYLEAMIARQVYYEGRVQGVGFRFSTKEIAKGFDVVGWVKNLPDGRVELQVAGEDSEVTAFLDEMTDGELSGFIRGVDVRQIDVPADLRGFEIRR